MADTSTKKLIRQKENTVPFFFYSSLRVILEVGRVPSECAKRRVDPKFEVLVCECCVCEMLCVWGRDVVCGMVYCGMLCVGDLCGILCVWDVCGMLCTWDVL